MSYTYMKSNNNTDNTTAEWVEHFIFNNTSPKFTNAVVWLDYRWKHCKHNIWKHFLYNC